MPEIIVNVPMPTPKAIESWYGLKRFVTGASVDMFEFGFSREIDESQTTFLSRNMRDPDREYAWLVPQAICVLVQELCRSREESCRD